MNETLLTQPAYQAETLYELSLRNRPSTANIWPEVFGNLKQRSIVSVTGSSGSGKSMFVMEMIARALLIEDMEILFLDVDKHFSIFKLVEILLKYTDEENARNCLKKLKMFTCYEDDFEETFSKLPQILESKVYQKVSMILIDSLGLYYYVHSETNDEDKNESKEAFIARYLQNIKNITQKYNLTAIYTTPGFMRSSSLPDLATLTISLVKHEDSFSMTTKDKSINFTISSSGLELEESRTEESEEL
jgi:energy-coupling factor transporter ATP-binding protein EcfA2